MVKEQFQSADGDSFLHRDGNVPDKIIHKLNRKREK